MKLLAEPAGRLLEHLGDQVPRGMIARDKTRLIDQLHLHPPFCFIYLLLYLQHAPLKCLAGDVRDTGRVLVLEVGLTEGDMRVLLHAIYVKACDVVGPVKSDMLLSRAMFKAESLPMSKLFDVRRLL